MKVLALSSHDIDLCADPDGLRKAAVDAFRAISKGHALNFPRLIAPLSHRGPLGFMPAAAPESGLAGYKAVSVFPANHDRHLDPHQGLVILLDPGTGQVTGLLDGASVTALRTAAASAAATDLLSRPSSHRLALIGAGRQAFEHARALVKVRPVDSIKIWNRTEEKAFTLARRLQETLGIAVKIAASAPEAVSEADLVVSCTSSPSPLFGIGDLMEGAHVNAVGACRPEFREVDLFSRPGLKIFLDQNDACEREAAEINHALQNHRLSSHHLRGELGQALNGTVGGRDDSREITFFKSVGLGVQDLYAGAFLLEQARQRGAGQIFEL